LNVINREDNVFIKISVILSVCVQQHDIIIVMMSLHHQQIAYYLWHQQQQSSSYSYRLL